jgi:hypothetical protein
MATTSFIAIVIETVALVALSGIVAAFILFLKEK